jgi:hypothetical protein
MKYFNPLALNSYGNSPQGFQMPYEIHDDKDKKIKEWKYYRLKNTSSRPTKVRCNSIVYGGLNRQTRGRIHGWSVVNR